MVLEVARRNPNLPPPLHSGHEGCDILDHLEMLNLLDEKPWDVYHSLKQWDWSEDD